MRISLKRGLAGALVLATTAAVAPIIVASPALAATNIVGSGGTISLSPSSGAAATSFSMNLTAPGGAAAVCPGDNNAGYKWSTFIIPGAADPESITFTGSGAVTAVAGEYRNSLYSGSTAVRNKFPDPVAATITGIPSVQFQFLDANTVIPDGAYNVGIACHGGPTGAAPSNYWAKTITISHAGGVFSYADGAAPSAPTIGTVTPGDGQLTVAFTQPAANPAVTGYTLSATPQGGGSTTTVTGAASPLVLTGLTNGTAYDLSLTSTNPAGTSPAATGTGTPAAPALDGPDVTATPAIESLDVSWTAPTTGPVPTGYTVSVSPDPAGGPFSTTVTGLSTSIPALTAGTPYTVTVTPLYSDPLVIATSGGATATPLTSGVRVQNIVAARPAGALVLTQNCLLDPTCTVTLTGATIDASGTYYTSTGTLYELTVSDTRDADAGWIVTGDLADTFTTSGDSFDSRAMGWEPNVTYDAPASPGGYDPDPVAGTTIAPNTSDAIKNGTAELFSAAPGAGLGVARATAGVTLQIPVSAIAGTYSAQLAISVA